MSYWFKQRLYRKMLAIILGLLLISYVFSGWFQITRMNDILLNNLKHEGETLVHTVADMSIEAMLSYDVNILNSHVNFAGKNNAQINKICIFDAENQLIAEYENTKAMETKELGHLFRNPIVIQEADFPAEVKGRVEVVLSDHRRKTLLLETSIKFAISRLIGLLIFFAVFLWLIFQQILKPINHLNEAINQISKDIDIDIIHLDTVDEFGRLTDTLNNMLEKKRYAQKKIIKQLSLLEQLNHQNKKTAESFARFVPMEFIDFLQKDSISDINLGDQTEKNMTILFSDIRNFTSLSENMSAKENFAFINNYLKHIGPLVRKHGGFIDKYIGDAIMALFPTPEGAVNTAIDMIETLKLFNKKHINEYAPVNIGIGIHSGELILGTIGEEQRMESTVISDAVNVASRLENMTKTHGATILLSHDTFSQLVDTDLIPYRFLGETLVKGKTAPISLYEILVSLDQHDIELKKATQPDFAKGLQKYYDKEFIAAVLLFSQIIKTNPDDKVARHYAERAARYVSKTPDLQNEQVNYLSLQ